MRGHIRPREVKGGDRRYDVLWRAGGRQHSKTFHRMKDAERYLATILKKVHEGSWSEVAPVLMKDVFREWLDDLDTRVKLGQLRASTAATYGFEVKHLTAAFGTYRSDQLSPSAVKKWRREMAEKIAKGEMAGRTFNGLLTRLHSILTWAREPAQRYIALGQDPLASVKRLKLRHKEAEFLEDDDMASLLQAVAHDPEANAIIHLGLFAGLRRGEIFALKWGDIEWGDCAGRVLVRRSIYGGKVTPPKSVSSERAIDVPPPVLAALAAHKSACPPLGSDFIFHTRTGTPIDGNTWYGRTFSKIRERAGLRPTVRLHSLRHTFASLLIRNNENPMYVSRQLGHGSTSFTMDVYGHLFESTSAEAMERLGRTISRTVAASRGLRVVQGGGGG